MYLVTGKGIVLFDTPWDSTQFQPLLDSLAQRHHQPVVLCIATHFHDDRTGGFDLLRSKGMKTYSSAATYQLCVQHNEKRAQYTFTKDTTFTVGHHTFQTYYPGKGHTKDNLVIWFGKEKVLYGGCFVKSTATNSLGNLADANTGGLAAVCKTRYAAVSPATVRYTRPHELAKQPVAAAYVATAAATGTEKPVNNFHDASSEGGIGYRHTDTPSPWYDIKKISNKRC